MTGASPAEAAPRVVGRVLYSGILTYMAIDGFLHNEPRVELARSKDVPMPELVVPATTALLLVANLGILFWKFPRASALAVIVFFVGTTPVIHDFWNLEGEARHGNKINFLKNVALLGGAFMLLAEASAE